MRWLHLTDFHVGKHHQAQDTALVSLTDAAERAAAERPVDLILLTGDIANTGVKEQYERATRTILDPLRSREPFAKARIVCVPGNHDINCKATLPVSWTDLDEERRTLFFDNSSDGRNLREPRANGFSAYSQFLKQNHLEGVDPTTMCCSAITVSSAAGDVRIISVNTAFLSDFRVSDRDKTPAPTLAIRTALNMPRPDSLLATVIVGHHPLPWFIYKTQEPFRSCLSEGAAFYLHGHEHDVTATTTVDGLETLGFGAAYPGPQDAGRSSEYSNSFALCELSDGQLHVAFGEWDGRHGRWVPKTTLPSTFREPSTLLANGYVVPVPTRRPGGPGGRRKMLPKAPVQAPPVARGLLALDVVTRPSWQWLLTLSATSGRLRETPPQTPAIAGEAVFFADDDAGLQEIHCHSGRGHVISLREVEAANTAFDTSEAETYTMVTLGQIDDEARALALRIARKKRFAVLTNLELAERLEPRLDEPLRARIRALSSTEHNVRLLLLPEAPASHESGISGDVAAIGLLVTGVAGTRWFIVVDGAGETVDEASAIVRSLRSTEIDLSRARYGESAGDWTQLSIGELPFDRERYTHACRSEFDEIRYAPLAAVGFRLPTAKLKEVYVPASAEVQGDPTAIEELRKAIDEILDTLAVDDATRTILRAQLLEKHAVPASREARGARAYYQEHKNLLVLGEPGSGKTCFVKNEILSYCDATAEDGSSWYRLHTPIYVPLAEAATVFSATKDLVASTADLCLRRGLKVTSEQLHGLIKSGQAAFFFDGLDEIVVREHRVSIVQAVVELMTRSIPLGNRFVLTSRPAAIEPADVPPGMVALHLQGLADGEMRLLATRILAAHVATDEGELRIAGGRVRTDELVDQIMIDCKKKPGIGRLARNPLLLTLLVMVYANAGAPAAKRHRIYGQAIQTLVSVRNRDAGSPVLSEADLRRRLGALALAIYERTVQSIPTRREVLRVFADAIRAEGLAEAEAEEVAQSFLQSVAENTGLLVLHRQSSADEHACGVSFMHHSFLEYYAAQGLILSRKEGVVAEMSDDRRWREVASLVAGIVGDTADVTDLVVDICKSRSPTDDILGERLLFAFDCALECDVPPAKCQQYLLDQAAESMRYGPARYDSDFRTDLAARVADLFSATGNAIVWSMLAAGMRDADAGVAASFVDTASRIAAIDEQQGVLASTFAEVLGRKDVVVQEAAFAFIARVSWSRSVAAIAALRRGMTSGGVLGPAAMRAIETVPELALKLQTELVASVNDTYAAIAGPAARILLANESRVSGELSDREALAKALGRSPEAAAATSGKPVHLRASRSQVDLLLTSTEQNERLFGLRLLPWLEREEEYVHARLIETLQARRTIAETLACLTAIRLAGSAMRLTTIGDYDALLSVFADERTDVRVGAARALAAMPFSDRVLEAMLERCRTALPREFRDVLRAVAVYAPTNSLVHALVRDRLREAIERAVIGTFGDSHEQGATMRLLAVAFELSVEVDSSLAAGVAEIVDDYRAPREIRKRALVTFGRITPTTAGAAQRVAEWLSAAPRRLLGAAPEITAREFAARARRSLASIRSVYPALGVLEDGLQARWVSLRGDASRLGHSRGHATVRSAMRDVIDLRHGYSEFGLHEGAGRNSGDE